MSDGAAMQARLAVLDSQSQMELEDELDDEELARIGMEGHPTDLLGSEIQPTQSIPASSWLQPGGQQAPRSGGALLDPDGSVLAPGSACPALDDAALYEIARADPHAATQATTQPFGADAPEPPAADRHAFYPAARTQQQQDQQEQQEQPSQGQQQDLNDAELLALANEVGPAGAGACLAAEPAASSGLQQLRRAPVQRARGAAPHPLQARRAPPARVGPAGPRRV
jgi:hypothetical protein